jgi:hypothetical protein
MENGINEDVAPVGVVMVKGSMGNGLDDGIRSMGK